MANPENSGNLFDSHFDNPADDPDFNDNYWQNQGGENQIDTKAPRQSEEIREISKNVASTRTELDRAFLPHAKRRTDYAS